MALDSQGLGSPLVCFSFEGPDAVVRSETTKRGFANLTFVGFLGSQALRREGEKGIMVMSGVGLCLTKCWQVGCESAVQGCMDRKWQEYSTGKSISCSGVAGEGAGFVQQPDKARH